MFPLWFGLNEVLNSNYESSCLLGRNIMQSGRCVLTFQANILLLSRDIRPSVSMISDLRSSGTLASIREAITHHTLEDGYISCGFLTIKFAHLSVSKNLLLTFPSLYLSSSLTGCSRLYISLPFGISYFTCIFKTTVRFYFLSLFIHALTVSSILILSV